VNAAARAARPSHAVVTVTYNPDLDALRRQLDAITAGTCIVVVDNASAERAGLGQLLAGRSAAALVANEANIGLAAALNVGAREALARVPDCQYLVFLDQDTEPPFDGVGRLVDEMARVRAGDPRVGLAGPRMVDADTGVGYGVHVVRRYRWTRLYPGPDDPVALTCAAVHGSGSIVPVDVFRSLGGFDESLFIYHVDTEWSFRVAAAGHRLVTMPAVSFRHRMGTGAIRYWLGGWRLWPYGTPTRHYYLFRNAITLMRRDYVPAVWKAWGVLKLAVTAFVHLLADRHRAQQLRAMLDGIRAARRRESGPRPQAG
jgi:rhamnosyltransferase